MKRRVWSIFMTIVFVVSVVSIGNETIVQASDDGVRGEYKLTPSSLENSEVPTDVTFELESQSDAQELSIESIEENLSIQPEVSFEVQAEGKGFRIIPKEDLDKGSIYVISYDGITWSYQTETDLVLQGVFPSDQATDVPTDTGIEFYFNKYDVDIEDSLSISPQVEGEFETHGDVVVFVPSKALEEGTIYTVTLDQGAGQAEDNKGLGDSYSFQFETMSQEETEESYIAFLEIMNEYSSDTAPVVPMVYDITDASSHLAKIKVYAYESTSDFEEALIKSQDKSYWSIYNSDDDLQDLTGMDQVLAYNVSLSEDQEDEESYLQLPDTLKKGYYILDLELEDRHIQTLIQVTDLSFYYEATSTDDLFWVHDLKTGKALEGVSIQEEAQGIDLKTDDDGLAIIDAGKTATDQAYQVFELSTDDDQAVFVQDVEENGTVDSYWSYFEPDRYLYQTDDTINFFGFIKDRYIDTGIDKVTVKLTKATFLYRSINQGDSQTLAYGSETVDVDQGFYEGSIDIPDLEEGSYTLAVYIGDLQVASSYIQVDTYDKPAYTLTLEKDKQAIFAGQTVTYDLSSKFYENTPAAYLDYNYTIYGNDDIEGTGTTDGEGSDSFQYTPDNQEGLQGESDAYVSAYASLPESGQISTSDIVRVFYNDINLDINASYDEDSKTEATLDVDVHSIDLTRLNDGSASSSDDYLGQVMEGQKITYQIQKNQWIPEETGEYYDYINKLVRKTYDYNLEKTLINEGTLITDKEGKASVKLDLPEEDSAYYTVTIATADTNGRAMTYTRYIGQRVLYSNLSEDYSLVQEKESYSIGDQVKLSVMKGQEEAAQGDYLFMEAQNGLIEASAQEDPIYKTTFTSKDIPNVTIKGVVFNGATYEEIGSQIIDFNIEDKRLDIEVETDKETYQPGDTMHISVEATYVDEDGQSHPVTDGIVNIALVDESLLSLRDGWTDPLSSLFTYVTSGFETSYSSHNYDEDQYFVYSVAGMGLTERAFMTSESMGEDSSDTTSVYIRSNFKDTAAFVSLDLDNNGQAKTDIRLPDNTTSWRMTASAFSQSLEVGSSQEDIEVSLPYFISLSMNSTYLVTDQAQIGVTGYGNDLSQDEPIEYSLSVADENGNVLSKVSQEGVAFVQTYLSLGEFETAGDYTVTIIGKREDGTTDAISQEINVLDTYLEVQGTSTQDVKTGMSIEGGSSGNTVLSFMDQGLGKYMSQLYNLANGRGKRIDQKYIAYLAQDKLNTSYGQDILENQVSLRDYVNSDGGYGILPYADSDLDLTVDMLSVLPNTVNTTSIKAYLENILEGDDIDQKGPALYGLAKLGQPVLDDLNYYSSVEGLTDVNRLYMALAYSCLNDTYKAETLYKETLEHQIQSYDTTAYVTDEDGEVDIELTALSMILTQKTDAKEAERYYTYLTSHTDPQGEYLANRLIYAYILEKTKNMTFESKMLTYDFQGQTGQIVLDDGEVNSLTVPSSLLDQFKISATDDGISLIATYKESLENIDTLKKLDGSSDISLVRTYSSNGSELAKTSFSVGDIVKVTLNIDIPEDSLDTAYEITDYVPSGLKPIESPSSMGIIDTDGWYRDIDGQKVIFYRYGGQDQETLVYYARIVSPGSYTAEATTVQGINITDEIYIGDEQRLTIEK